MDAEVCYVASPGARLAVREYPGQGAPILLLHGGPGFPHYLAPVARLLSPALHAVSFDQRGVGDSTTLDDCYSLDAYLADIEAVRTHLGLARWHVFGHSWGGVLAQRYAWTYPDRVRSLFLSDAALGVGEDWRRTIRAALGHMLRTAGKRFTAAIVMEYIVTWLPGRIGAASTRRLYRRIWRSGFPDARRAEPPDPAWLSGVNRLALHKTNRAVLSAANDTLPGEWPDPPFPVLVLYGGADLFGDASRIVRDRFPAAAQARLGDAAHFPWLQTPEAFARLLAAFYHQEPFLLSLRTGRGG